MKNIRNLIRAAFGLMALVLVIAGAFGYMDLAFLNGHDAIDIAFPAAVGATISGEAVTTEGAGAASPDLLRPTIDQNITLIQPDKFPFDTVLRNASIHKKINSFETKFYSSETRGITDTVESNVSATSGTSPEWTIHDIPVNAYYQWNVDDNMLVNEVNGSDGLPLVLHVIAKTSPKTLKTIALNGIGTLKGDIPPIDADKVISRIGVAKAELDASTSPYGVMPTPSFNYAQIHMQQVEESFLERAHAKEVKFDINDMYNQALWDFRSQVEFASLMGVKRIAYDPESDNEQKYFSGGLLRDISKELTYNPAVLSNKEFYAMSKSIFTGNNGSDTKILFASPDYMSYLGGVPTIQKQLEGKNTVVKYGVKFNEIETNFGTLLIKLHPGFDYIGMANNAAVLDMAFVEKHVWKPLASRKIDYKTSGIKDADANVIKEISCAVLKNLNTHAIIRPA